jgi:hypothetical protein
MSDLFESVILNTFRKLIAVAVVTAVVVSVPTALVGYKEFKATPAVTTADLFDLPVFEVVVDQEEPDEPEAEPDPGWQHPMPEHQEAIDRIIASLMPLYITYFNMEGQTQERQSITDFFYKVYLSDIEMYMTDQQVKEVVAGMGVYAADAADYFMEKYDIPTIPDFYLKRYGTLEPDDSELQEGGYFAYIKSMARQEVPDDANAFLSRPGVDYFSGARDSYYELVDDAYAADENAADTNAHGAEVLTVALFLVMLATLLILVLMLFKIEQSLRRASEASQ